MVTDIDLGWAIWFTGTQIVIAIATFKLIPWTYLRMGSLVWFMTQAVDEATGRNIWTEDTGPWEYIAFAVLATASWYLHTREK